MSRGGLARAILLMALFVLLLAAVASAGLIRRGDEMTEAELLSPEEGEPGANGRLTAGGFQVSGRFNTVENAGNTYVRFCAEEGR